MHDIVFPQGLPAFEHLTKFRLAEPEGAGPLLRMESLESPEVAFWLAPVALIEPRYELEFEMPADNLLCLAILSAPEDGPLTANLLAPVVINVDTGIGVQAVRSDTRYSHAQGIVACS